MRHLLFGFALSAASVVATSSFAAEAVCASGFDASPATINGSEEYNQHYKCTGPEIKCSKGFHPLGSPVPVTGGIGGSTDSGPPVTIKDGRMVYTCAEPESPPK